MVQNSVVLWDISGQLLSARSFFTKKILNTSYSMEILSSAVFLVTFWRLLLGKHRWVFLTSKLALVGSIFYGRLFVYTIHAYSNWVNTNSAPFLGVKISGHFSANMRVSWRPVSNRTLVESNKNFSFEPDGLFINFLQQIFSFPPLST